MKMPTFAIRMVRYGGLIIFALGFFNETFGQEGRDQAEIKGPVVSFPVAPVELNIDLSNLSNRGQDFGEGKLEEVPLRGAEPQGFVTLPSETEDDQGPGQSEVFGGVGIIQTDSPGRKRKKFAPPNPNFDGIAQFDAGANFIPPDPNGDVGRNYFIQTGNASIAIFDKKGNTLLALCPSTPYSHHWGAVRHGQRDRSHREL